MTSRSEECTIADTFTNGTNGPGSTPATAAPTTGSGNASTDSNNDPNDTGKGAACPASETDPSWLTFPPFPTPPQDVELIPFKDFKPLGIRISPDSDSDKEKDLSKPEVDGLGIPTVQLNVHHGMGKKRKNNKQKASACGVRKIWYEEWAENENARGLSVPIDPSMSRADRLFQAAYDFRVGRPLVSNQELSTLWDRFRLYVGLTTYIQPTGTRKLRPGQRFVPPPPEVDEDEEEEEMPNASLPRERKINVVNGPVPSNSTAATSSQSALTTEEQQKRREFKQEVRDTRMDRFLNDPETAVKIFFSGYYRDRGMMGSERNCRDGPMLVQYFINFLLRNRVYPEMEKHLRKALAVVEVAKFELLQTFVISHAIPDSFSTGCEMIYGKMNRPFAWSSASSASENDGEPEAKRQKTEDKGKDEESQEVAALQAAAGAEQIEVITPDTIMDMEQDMKEAVAAAAMDGAPPPSNTAAGTWGDPAPGDAHSWGTPAPGTEWGAPAGADDWGKDPTENPLMRSLGATVLPLTHTTGIVERSTRRIKSIVMPPTPDEDPAETVNRVEQTSEVQPARLQEPEAVERAIEEVFAKVTLVPWHEWDVHDLADVRKPQLLPDSRGAAVTDDCEGAEVTAGPGSPHNPFKDEVAVYVERSTAEKLVVGMGIGATWVQLARVDPGVPIVVQEELFNSMWPYDLRKDAGGPGVPVMPSKFWYMEQVMVVLPSFHHEMVPLPTTEEVFGGDAVATASEWK